jgi:hypothetical protein
MVPSARRLWWWGQPALARPGPVFAAGGRLPDPYLAPGLTRFTEELTQPPAWTPAQLASRGLTMKESVHRFHRQLGTTEPGATAG